MKDEAIKTLLETYHVGSVWLVHTRPRMWAGDAEIVKNPTFPGVVYPRTVVVKEVFISETNPDCVTVVSHDNYGFSAKWLVDVSQRMDAEIKRIKLIDI